MKNTKLSLSFAILGLLITFPAVSAAVTDEEIIESVKKEPAVRQKMLEVTLPVDRREKLDNPEKAIDEMINNSEVFLVPLNSQCGVAGCGGSTLVVIRHSRHTTNPGSRYVAALVRIINMKIKEISLARISAANDKAE